MATLKHFFVILCQKDVWISTEIKTHCCHSFDSLRLPWTFWIATTAPWLQKDTRAHKDMYIHVGSSVNAVFLKLGRTPVQPGLAVDVGISCSVFCVKFTSEVCFLKVGNVSGGKSGGAWRAQVTEKHILLLFHFTVAGEGCEEDLTHILWTVASCDQSQSLKLNFLSKFAILKAFWSTLKSFAVIPY